MCGCCCFVACIYAHACTAPLIAGWVSPHALGAMGVCRSYRSYGEEFLGCFFSFAGSLKHRLIGAWTAGLSLGSVICAAADLTWRDVSVDSRGSSIFALVRVCSCAHTSHDPELSGEVSGFSYLARLTRFGPWKCSRRRSRRRAAARWCAMLGGAARTSSFKQPDGSFVNWFPVLSSDSYFYYSSAACEFECLVVRSVCVSRCVLGAM